jgi:Asp-tRNA(Asn)/Glu-tRNA(Gln) amidotransferase A subunit family amidase
MPKPRELSICDALNLMRKGELKAEDLVLSCLDRIRLREDTIHAWVEVAEEKALLEARHCDDEFRAGRWRGDLHGIPIGVKDIIDVMGMWTRAGCSVYPARVAESDAAAVRQARNSGAIILGKTETTAFANNDPTGTRNPWNTEHTPGGSSSGSGAAVPDRMCLAALGTQTGGSVLRPAAYNGVVGFKPTYASVSLEGVVPVSWTLDHVGTLSRNVEDAALLYSIIKDENPQPFARMPVGFDVCDQRPLRKPFRFGYFQSFIDREADPPVRNHFESLLGRFRQAGALVFDIEFSDSLIRAEKAHRIIMDTELASYHRDFFGFHRKSYPPNIKARIERGMEIRGYQYIEAIRQRIVDGIVGSGLRIAAHGPLCRTERPFVDRIAGVLRALEYFRLSLDNDSFRLRRSKSPVGNPDRGGAFAGKETVGCGVLVRGVVAIFIQTRLKRSP